MVHVECDVILYIIIYAVVKNISSTRALKQLVFFFFTLNEGITMAAAVDDLCSSPDRGNRDDGDSGSKKFASRVHYIVYIKKNEIR